MILFVCQINQKLQTDTSKVFWGVGPVVFPQKQSIRIGG